MVKTSDILRQALKKPWSSGICCQISAAACVLGLKNPQDALDLQVKAHDLADRISKSIHPHAYVVPWLERRGYRLTGSPSEASEQLKNYRIAWMQELLREYEAKGD